MMRRLEAAANRPPRFQRSELEWVTAGVIAILCVAYAIVPPAAAALEMIDHRLFRLTVEAMREGVGYYDAMEAAIAQIYGPERAAVTETIRAFRMPTTFVVWALLPSERAVWYLYVAVSGLTGVLSMRLVKRPLLAVTLVAYLLSIGMFLQDGAWTSQFMTTELWAVPPLVASVGMVIRQRWWPAALLALVALLVRETAAPLVLAGAGLAVLGRVPRKPWLTSAAVGALVYAGHVMLASTHIDPGVETPLLGGAEIPLSTIRMMGFGLPMELILGPILWVLAWWHVRLRYEHWLLVGTPLLLPFVGLIVERDYWGLLVAPFVLLWGLDRIADLVIPSGRAEPASEAPG